MPTRPRDTGPSGCLEICFRALADRLLDPSPAVITAACEALYAFRAVGYAARPFEPAVRAALESLVVDHPDVFASCRERAGRPEPEQRSAGACALRLLTIDDSR